MNMIFGRCFDKKFTYYLTVSSPKLKNHLYQIYEFRKICMYMYINLISTS